MERELMALILKLTQSDWEKLKWYVDCLFQNAKEDSAPDLDEISTGLKVILGKRQRKNY